jgi:hypothetical protein
MSDLKTQIKKFISYLKSDEGVMNVGEMKDIKLWNLTNSLDKHETELDKVLAKAATSRKLLRVIRCYLFLYPREALNDYIMEKLELEDHDLGRFFTYVLDEDTDSESECESDSDVEFEDCTESFEEEKKAAAVPKATKSAKSSAKQQYTKSVKKQKKSPLVDQTAKMFNNIMIDALPEEKSVSVFMRNAPRFAAPSNPLEFVMD